MTVVEIDTLDEETFEKLLSSLRNANSILWLRNKEIREENRRLGQKLADLEATLLDYELSQLNNKEDGVSTIQRPA